MKVRSLLSVAAIVSAMALPGLVVAQEEGHMIGGKAVTADQTTAVQAKCDELRKAAPAADAASTPAAAPAAAPAADAAATATPAATNEGWTEDGTAIDLDKLTVALCDEGKFTAPAM